MFEIKKSPFGCAVYLNGICLRICHSEESAAKFIAEVRTGSYTQGTSVSAAAAEAIEKYTGAL